MKAMTPIIRAIAPVLALAPCITAANIQTFTDRTSWTTAVGAIDFTVSFESFTTDTSFASAPLNLGPFTLSVNGVISGRDFVDVSPFLFPPLPASFGNAAADVFVQGPLTVDLTPTSPIHGLFADFLNAGNGQQLDLTLSLSGGGTADILVPGTGNGLVPFGFVSMTDSITRIRLNNTVNDGLYLDNISGAAAQASVPEPSSLSNFGLVLLGLAVRYLSQASVTR